MKSPTDKKPLLSKLVLHILSQIVLLPTSYVLVNFVQLEIFLITSSWDFRRSITPVNLFYKDTYRNIGRKIRRQQSASSPPRGVCSKLPIATLAVTSTTNTI